MPKAAAETFWTRLDANLGAFNISTLEKAAGLGKCTLLNARNRGSTPTLDTVLAVCRSLGVPALTLLGPDTPTELLQSSATPDDAIRRIPFNNLTVSHLNPRRTIDEGALTELAESIAEKGLLQNLVVRQDEDQPAIYWIVAGERRYRALLLLGAGGRFPKDLQTLGVPCRVITATDAEHTILALLENMQREEVSPLDEAEAMHRLHTLDPKLWSATAIAQHLGVTPRLIQLRLQMVKNLAPAAKLELRAGKINLNQARVLARLPTILQEHLLQDAVTGTPADELFDPTDYTPTSLAIFDVKKSGLETFPDPEDQTKAYFVSREAFLSAQRAAVAIRKADLLREGVEKVIDLTYDQPHRYVPGGNIAVIVSELSGRVSIRLGLKDAYAQPSASHVRADDDDDDLNLDAGAVPSHPARAKVPPLAAAWRRYRQEVDEARAAFRGELEQNLSDNHFALLLLAEFANQGDAGTVIDPQGVDVAPLLGVTSEEFDKTCEADDDHAFFAMIKTAAGNDPQAVLRRVVFAMVPTSTWGRQPASLPEAWRDVARECHVAVPDILCEDQAEHDARISRYVSEVEGQTDIEDAIADAAA
jgi:ParB family chromosome partitioning protein